MDICVWKIRNSDTCWDIFVIWAEPEGKALNLLVDRCFNPHIWSWALVSCSRYRIVRISFVRRGAGLTLRDRVSSSDIWEHPWVGSLLLCIEKSQLRWIRWMPPDPRSRPRPVLYIPIYPYPFGLETSWDPLGVAGILASCLAASVNPTQISGQKWTDWSTHFIHVTIFYFFYLNNWLFKTCIVTPKIKIEIEFNPKDSHPYSPGSPVL